MSPRIPTLRGRLALVAAITTAVWVGLLTAGFNVLLASQLHVQSGSLLRQRAAAGAATVVVDPSGRVSIRDPAYDEALDTDLWIYRGSVALERPRAGRQVQRLADTLTDSGERYAQTREPSGTRLFAFPVRSRGRQVGTVVSAVSLNPYRNVARLALVGSTALALLLLAGVYAVTRLLLGRALAPVQQMSTQAARWSEADASARFGAAERPGELALLARNLDGVLDRQTALLRHEQQVTEELSHELRTPLSLITAEADLLLSRRRTPHETEAAVRRIAAGAGHLQRIIETLLTAARTRSPDTTGRCVLLPVVQQAVARAPAGGPSVVVTPAAVELVAGVDAELVDRILAPLLDNAVRYAGSRVDVRLSKDADCVVVQVTDDGPGVDPALGAAVFEPGRRDATTPHAGAGLGLALARRLARAGGGDLRLSDGAFELRLPRG